ncbi:unnamed protein product, partial [Laminaria digitata]
EDSDGQVGGGFSNQNKKPRTEAFTAVPAGAQAYFNSQAGVGTLAIIPGGIASASSIAESNKRGAAAAAGRGGKGKPQKVLRRGYHTRNRISRMAKEDRLQEEKASRKRAREK